MNQYSVKLLVDLITTSGYPIQTNHIDPIAKFREAEIILIGEFMAVAFKYYCGVRQCFVRRVVNQDRSASIIMCLEDYLREALLQPMENAS